MSRILKCLLFLIPLALSDWEPFPPIDVSSEQTYPFLFIWDPSPSPTPGYLRSCTTHLEQFLPCGNWTGLCFNIPLFQSEHEVPACRCPKGKGGWECTLTGPEFSEPNRIGLPQCAGTSAEREFRPIMSPWYPECKMFEQNYCGNLLVKQKRHLIYYRRNETDFECYLTNSTNPVVLQTFSSLLKIEKYTTETEREVVCNLHLNGDPASTYVHTQDAEIKEGDSEIWQPRVTDWFPKCSMFKDTHCGNWRLKQSRLCVYYETAVVNSQNEKQCVYRTSAESHRMCASLENSTDFPYERETDCFLPQCEVQTVFQRTDDSWHDAGSFADFQFFGETSRGQICEIGKLNDRNKDRSLNKLYFYSLEKKCSKDLQMQKDEIFVKLHIYGLPIRKDQWDDRWIFDELAVMVNGNVGWYNGSQIKIATDAHFAVSRQAIGHFNTEAIEKLELKLSSDQENKFDRTYDELILDMHDTEATMHSTKMQREFFVRLHIGSSWSVHFQCEGALINDRWIVTLNYCILDGGNIELEFGDFSTSRGKRVKTKKIREIIQFQHDTDARSEADENIMLIHLADPIEKKFASPIPLCQETDSLQMSLRVCAMSQTTGNFQEFSMLEMQAAEMEKNSTVLNAFGAQKVKNSNDCFGKQGSPLFAVDSQSNVECLFGLRKNASYICDYQQSMWVNNYFRKISPYKAWIEKTIQQNSK